MKYLAVLGRQPEISIAELEALFFDVKQFCYGLASFSSTGDGLEGDPQNVCLQNFGGGKPAGPVEIKRLGGVLKLAIELKEKPLEFLSNLPDGKITFGVSDYSKNASKKTATTEALKLKKILVRHGRSVRVVENKEAVLSTATSLHNGLSGKNEKKVEFIKVDDDWYRVIGVQNIDAYTKRDQKRPARDAKVGMLPPKLAQILINLCGVLPENTRILDPFCGTGVVLQEAILMGYQAYGTDISERMVEYTEKNLNWLVGNTEKDSFLVSKGDATSFQWVQPIDAVVCEGYLGKPMSQIPSDIELKEQKQECKSIMIGFLKNLAKQVKSGTPVVVAIPSWLRDDGSYSRLEILDDIQNMGYNVDNKSRDGLLYHRDNQIVARDIIILRKK